MSTTQLYVDFPLVLYVISSLSVFLREHLKHPTHYLLKDKFYLVSNRKHKLCLTSILCSSIKPVDCKCIHPFYGNLSYVQNDFGISYFKEVSKKPTHIMQDHTFIQITYKIFKQICFSYFRGLDCNIYKCKFKHPRLFQFKPSTKF